MSDYIKREDAIAAVGRASNIIRTIQRIEKLPAADVVEHKYGKWEVKPKWYNQTFDECTCSECGAVEYFNVGWKWFNFCPNCGADMR